MIQHRLRRVFEFGNDALRQNLAQLDTLLVERVDIPYDTLSEDGMLTELNLLSELSGYEAVG